MEQAVLVSRHNSDERLSGMIIFSLLFLLEEWPNGDIIYELMALIRNKFFLIKLDFNIFVVYDVLIVNDLCPILMTTTFSLIFPKEVLHIFKY